MTTDQLWFMVWTIVIVGGGSWAVFDGFPSLHRDRLIIRSSEMRSELAHSGMLDKSDDAYDGVRLLDRLLAQTIKYGAPGVPALVVATMTVVRMHRGKVAPPPPIDLSRLQSAERLLAERVHREATAELARATLLGSKLWIGGLLVWGAFRLVVATQQRASTEGPAADEIAVVSELLRKMTVNKRGDRDLAMAG